MSSRIVVAAIFLVLVSAVGWGASRDDEAPSQATGATGPDGSHGHDPNAPTDWLITPISDATLSTGNQVSKFLLDSSDQNEAMVVNPGFDYISNFNIANDKLDLTQLLNGSGAAADLSNIGNFVHVSSSPNDPGYGAGFKTELTISGPGGSATVNLEGAGTITLSQLVSNDSLIVSV